MWDAGQYEKFRDERSRPFFDLLARIPDAPYRTIADLGCGTGDLTQGLLGHWPAATVRGVDSSDEMLKEAMKHTETGRLTFEKGDALSWRPERPLDLVVSNATFQWIPDRARLLAHVASTMSPQGVLAVQVPANGESPSHTILEEIASRAPWADSLRSRLRHDVLTPLREWVRLLWGLGLAVDAWETVYHHVLAGEDPVLEWMKGTALRPVIALLDPERCAAFLEEYRARLREAYPAASQGTAFPFRRLFFVARKP
jgi:trans-aconitate 2-methyltransferase